MSRLPEASKAESLRVVRTGLLPALARGLFKPRRGAMKWLTSLNTDARAIKALRKVRKKHGGEGARLMGGKMVVVWGEDALHEVLDRSADVYASDAGAKAKGMCHFQPDALTLSRSSDWSDRRVFNETVLASGERVHPYGARFAAVVADEVGRMDHGRKIDWAGWERLFDHITLRVVFGDRAREDQDITDMLEQLMAQANRIAGLKQSELYFDFYGRLESQLKDPEPLSLLARFAEAPQSTRTRVVQQIPHWIFAMRDTLGANAYRALAAILADPEVERRVREEIEGADLTDAAAIDGMHYLEGVLHEAMRLWPTTPLIARETTRQTELLGETLEEGTQVMIMNVFNHRDTDQTPDADRLVPERWNGGPRSYRFNHLSNGTQDCPGGPLVLLLGKAVLAGVLVKHSPRLEERPYEPGEPLPEMLDFFALEFAT